MAMGCELLTILRRAYLNSTIKAGGVNEVKREIEQVILLTQHSQLESENYSLLSCVKPRVAPN